MVIVPGTSLLAQISKTDTLRLVDSTHMGGYNSESDSQIVQELVLGPTPQSPSLQHKGESNPVAWTAPGGPMIYFQTWYDPLRQFQLIGGQMQLVATNDDATAYYPGAGLSVSSNGSLAGTGIVWGLTGSKDFLGGPLQTGTLMAFDAADVSRTLWASPASDDWLYVVHTKPTIANGRVYVPTASNEIAVYTTR